ncbi:2-keto-4-pentenoate hydratase [Natrarchaeobaculum aegyptiacum]|uniref:2-oxopent-4-enoate hydratase n=1 Tax=Natrarchaeobaculum aegyptiacum TaxID=745377 RepID=A0A2Z2HV47_9EURY|nr:2-keto-4-pentenoate hydratase [Natrarchaeobaculum aegyptiacum]ARS91071.1 2-oxopent-4-enoate hydratase [Natrarchaeobaculum aegyptiacum]
MSLEDDTRDRLADSLYDALQTGEPIDRLSDAHDLTIEDAYAVQSAFVDRRIADGATVEGHKIGLTSDGIQEQLGVSEPDFGRLLDTMYVDGRSIPAADLIAPRVEPEIGFVLADDLEPPVTAFDVLSATEFVLPVLEIIDSRIRDWDIGIEDTIADNASSALYLTGETRCDPDGLDLSLEGVKLYRNGDLAASGVGAAVLENPANAVAWLANTLEEVGGSLEAGHLVLSGSLTPAVDVESGDSITVEFTSIGSLVGHVG